MTWIFVAHLVGLYASILYQFFLLTYGSWMPLIIFISKKLLFRFIKWIMYLIYNTCIQ